jgi:ABC-2 type transport system ATP-binding protein
MLEVSNLSKIYNEKTIFDTVQIGFEPGIIGVLGKNGTGKSTFLNILAGLIRKSSGEILFNGKNIDDDIINWKRQIGLVPEFPQLFPKLSIMEHIELSIKLYKLNTTTEEVTNYLELFDLINFKDYYSDECSQGMKKKLSIILSIIHSPSVLILDEPFNALDIEGSITLKKMLLDYNKDKNKIILITSHILESLEPLVDTLLYIKNKSFKKSQSRI